MISSRLLSLRRQWDIWSRKPFPTLVRLFLGRIFRGGGESGQDELDLSMGLVLTLLPLPGAFYSVFLFEKYSTLLQWMQGRTDVDPLSAAFPDEYFFIAFSMVVTGIVAVWRWDSIFPDRRDYANLVPLPLSTLNIFFANLLAILLLTLVLAIDVNAASALLFPLVVSASVNAFSFFVHFFLVHAFVLVLASLFGFFAVFVIVGILMATLPYVAFRRVSLYLRGIIIACFVALLSTSFAVPSQIEQPDSAVRFLPPVWFLGLCQLLRGRASPSLASLGRLALIGSAAVIATASVTYALSYRRCFTRIPETTDVSPPSTGGHLGRIFRTLDRIILTSPFQRAGYRFVMKTLLRSEHHGLVLGGFFGLGVVTASQFLFAAFGGKPLEAGSLPSAEVLAVPLILSYCIILGVRLVFDIPTELRANWVFRLSLAKNGHECVPLARKVMLTFVLPWVFAIALPLYAYLWGWRVGVLQTAVVTVWSLLLAEILLLRFRKIPFTCSYPPFRDSAVVIVLLYILGFFLFVGVTSKLEYWALSDTVLILWLAGIPVVVWYVLTRFQEGRVEVDEELIFEELPHSGFELLDLGHGA
jgi:hypothetical protein